MLRRLYRFHGYNSLHFVYRRGATVRTNDLSLKYIRNPKRKNFRIAVVVAKKVNKSAVVRNRIRRRIFEQVRQHAQEISQPYDLVITVNSDRVATMEHHELAKYIRQLLQQAGIVD